MGLDTAEALMSAFAHRAPEAILMDVRIPGLSGLDALKGIKGDPATARLSAPMLTGDGRLDRTASSGSDEKGFKPAA